MTDRQGDPTRGGHADRGNRGGDGSAHNGGGGTAPGRGPGDEKGDQRRHNPTHSGPTRPGASNRKHAGGDDKDDSDD
jgi:hypothetical protein